MNHRNFEKIRKIQKYSCSFLLSFLVIYSSLSSYIFDFVYASENVLSQAYIYDVFSQELVKESPFVSDHIQEAHDINEMLGVCALTAGVSFAGYPLQSRQVKNLKDLYDKAKAIENNSQDFDRNCLGSAYYYNGDLYAVKGSYGELYHLPDSMSGLSPSEIKGILGDVNGGTASDIDDIFHLLTDDQVNSLLLYGGEFSQPFRDLMDAYKEIYGTDNINYGNEPIGTIIGTNVVWACYDDPNYGYHSSLLCPYAQGVVDNTVVYFRTGRLSDPYSDSPIYTPLYWRVSVDGYYIAYDGGAFGIAGQMGYPMAYIFAKGSMNIDNLEHYNGDPTTHILGTYGNSFIPIEVPHMARRGGILTPGNYYDCDDVDRGLGDFNDDVDDMWDSLPGSYNAGTDDDGNYPIFDPQGDIIDYGTLVAPVVDPLDPDDPGEDPDDPGGDPDDPGGDPDDPGGDPDDPGGDPDDPGGDPDDPDDDGIQKPNQDNNPGGGIGNNGDLGGGGTGGGDIGLPPVSWNGIDLDLDNLYIPDLSGLFPFCIPYDIYNGVKGLSVESQSPIWIIPLHIEVSGNVLVDTSFTIDLTTWSLGSFWQVIRGLTLLSFIIGLALFTFKIVNGG